MRLYRIEGVPDQGTQRRKIKVKQDLLWLCELSDLFPGWNLLVNVSVSVISLVPVDQNGHVIAQRILTEAEMRMLLPLLDSPTCCEQAVLQASSSCEYAFLLQVLLSSDEGIASSQWRELVKQQRDRLSLALEKKSRRTEMRGVYNALYGLRQKLEPLGLTVRVRRDGYYLALLVEGQRRGSSE